MKLSIVVPVLNEGRALAGRLRALQPLRERGAELLVVDGGSTDTTWVLASVLADRVLLAPRGRASQMNAGARQSQGDTLLFLHADTALPELADQLVSAALQQGHDWGRFDARIDSHHAALRLIERMMNLRSRLTGIATGDQAMFVRRRVFEALNGFAELPLMEDVDLSVRLKRRGPPACLRTPVITSGRRWDTQGVWRTVALMWRLRAAYALGTDPHVLARQYGYAPGPTPGTAAVAILAKAPVPGFSKTRLIPTLGAAGAARAQRQFTSDTLRAVVAAALGPVTLWCAPAASQRFFRALQRACGIDCRSQPDGDLGARMMRAIEHHFSLTPDLPLLLVGTDCPVLAPGHLQLAAQTLRDHDAVLIPAEDGGYVLIGMRRLLAGVFDGIAWSSPDVMRQTRAQLAVAGAHWHEMHALWDVDEAPDWHRLKQLHETS